DSWLKPARRRNRPDRPCSGSVLPDGSLLRSAPVEPQRLADGSGFLLFFCCGGVGAQGACRRRLRPCPTKRPRTCDVRREHALFRLALSTDVFFLLAAPLA